jgi:predicted Fe-S protein YdhL (DUF1289 family)
MKKKEIDNNFFCDRCLAILRSKNKKKHWDNMSKEEKEKSLTHLNTNEVKKKRVESNKKYLNNLTDEEKIEFGRKISNGLNNRSKEKKILHRKRISIGLKKYFDNLPYEEREKKSNKNKKWYNSQSDEYKKNNRIKLQKASINYWNSNKNRWEIMSISDFHEQCRLSAIKFNKNNNSIPIMSTEIEFDNILKKYHLDYKYQYSNIIKHKDFDNIFPYNIVTDTNRISPYHRWDFIIYTKHGNILVDIDGSEHSIEPGLFIAKDRNHDVGAKIQFNDSKRLYQTDGLDAYIIECYDDILNNNTKVLDLKNNKYLTVKDLINTILIMNMNKEEFKEAI